MEWRSGGGEVEQEVERREVRRRRRDGAAGGEAAASADVLAMPGVLGVPAGPGRPEHGLPHRAVPPVVLSFPARPGPARCPCRASPPRSVPGLCRAGRASGGYGMVRPNSQFYSAAQLPILLGSRAPPLDVSMGRKEGKGV